MRTLVSPWAEFGLKTWDPFVIIDSVLDRIIEAVPSCDGASLEMLSSDNYLIYVNCAGKLKPFVGLTVDVKGSLSGKAMLTGETQISSDTFNDAETDRQACEITGIRSMALLPLRYNLQVFGVLKISSSVPNSITQSDVELVELLAEFVALAVGSLSELSTLASRYLAFAQGHHLTTGTSDKAMEVVDEFVSKILAPHATTKLKKRQDVESLFVDGKLNIVFQPIVDLVSGMTCSIEALSRFKTDPYRSPDLWYKDANEVHLGVELELHAIDLILKKISQIPDHVDISLNVSPEAIMSYHLSDLLDSLTYETSKRLILEITEHVVVEDYAELNFILNKFRENGIKVAIDDTGSGISSLTHILEICPDIIKLDRSLITNIDSDPVRFSLANALVVFANKINATVVAEGIETNQELETVGELGINMGQGFFLARPAPLSDLF